MRDLPIPLLRTFIMVADTLNLSIAASRLHKAPSTISMQLARLESLVSTQLLERGQYGVRLTPAGEQLLNHAQQLLTLHDQIVGRFQNSDIDEPVRLGTHEQYATRSLAPLLESFVLSYPEAQLEVTSDHRPFHLQALVKDRKLDLALVEMPAGTEGGVDLAEDQLVWIGSARHQTHQRPVIPLALFPEGCFHRDSALKALTDEGREYRIAFSSQSRAGVLAAVRAGMCVAVVPRSTVDDEMMVIEEGLPPLPKTRAALLIAENCNQLSQHLAETIRESRMFG